VKFHHFAAVFVDGIDSVILISVNMLTVFY